MCVCVCTLYVCVQSLRACCTAGEVSARSHTHTHFLYQLYTVLCLGGMTNCYFPSTSCKNDPKLFISPNNGGIKYQPYIFVKVLLDRSTMHFVTGYLCDPLSLCIGEVEWVVLNKLCPLTQLVTKA